MKIHLRIDDYPFGDPEEKAAYNKEKEAEKIHELNQLGKVMVGCVMDYMTDYEWNIIDKNSNIVPCIHGFTHNLDKWVYDDCLRMKYENEGGEFKGLSRQDIWDRFEGHLYRIDKHQIKIFIPPFNSFTQDLIYECTNVGIEYITGGPETIRAGMNNLYFENIELKLIDIYGLEHLVHTINKMMPLKEYYTVCLHLRESEIFKFIPKFIKNNNIEIIAYGQE